MKTAVFLATILGGILSSIFLMATQTPANSNFLDNYRWEKRVLLVFIPDKLNAAGKEQLNLINQVSDELIERDIQLLIITGDKLEDIKAASEAGKSLRNQFTVANNFTMVLIGKDGGEKYRTKKVEKPVVIFNIIDAMPMRQSEMNAQRKQK